MRAIWIPAAGLLALLPGCAHRPPPALNNEQLATRRVLEFIATGGELRAWDRAAEVGGDSLRAYMRRFWLRRDPTPDTPQNEYALRFNARLQQATRELVAFPGAGSDDRVVAWVLYGRPARIVLDDPAHSGPYGIRSRKSDGTLWVWWHYLPDKRIEKAALGDPMLGRMEYAVHFTRDGTGRHEIRPLSRYPFPQPPQALSERGLRRFAGMLTDPETDEDLAAAILWRLRADPRPEAMAVLLKAADQAYPLVREQLLDAVEPLEVERPAPGSFGVGLVLPSMTASRNWILDHRGNLLPRDEEEARRDQPAPVTDDPVLLGNLLTAIHDPADHLTPNTVRRLESARAVADDSEADHGWLTPARRDSLYVGPLAVALAHLEAGDLRQMHETLDPLLRTSLRENAEAWFLDATALLESPAPGGRQMAEERVRQALRLDPGNLRYRLLLATIYQRRSLEYYADDLVEQIISEVPSVGDAYAIKGILRLQTYWAWGWKGAGWGAPVDGTGMRPEVAHTMAIEMLEQALVVDPDNPLASWWLGLDALLDEDWSRAIPIMSRMVRHGVHAGEALLGRGWALQSMGQHELAWADYERGLSELSDDLRSAASDPRWVLSPSVGGFTLSGTRSGGGPLDHTLPGSQAAGAGPARALPDSVAGPDGLLSNRERFWRARDPLFSSSVNERLLEQYRRFAYVTWHFALPNLGLRGWETQRGQIYLRYGEPLHADDQTDELREKMLGEPRGGGGEEVNWVASEAENRWISIKETWSYPSVTFTFGGGAISGNLVLWPADRADPRIVDSIADFEKLANEVPELDQVVGGSYVAPMRAAWYAFRGAEGGVDLVNAARLPVLAPPPGGSSGMGGDGPHRIHLITLDAEWNPLLRAAIPLPTRDLVGRRGSAWVSPIVEGSGEAGRPSPRFAAVELITSFTDTAFAMRQELPDLSGEGPQMSSLVLASNVVDVVASAAWPERARFVRGTTAIVPRPERDFSLNEPLFLYYEIYGLRKDEIGATSYRIVFSVTAQEDGRGIPVVDLLGRLIGREEQEGTVRIVTHREGILADVQESIRLVFPSGIQADRYRVTITIEDEVSGKSVERSIELRRR